MKNKLTTIINIFIVSFLFSCKTGSNKIDKPVEAKKINKAYGLDTDSLGIHQVVSLKGMKFELNTYVKTELNQFHLHSAHWYSGYYDANYAYDVHLTPATFEEVKKNKPIEFEKAKMFLDSVTNLKKQLVLLQDSVNILNKDATIDYPLTEIGTGVDSSGHIMHYFWGKRAD